MLSADILKKKAELISSGEIYIPKGFTLPYYPSRSTAGPGAGSRAMVFGFNDTRVKLAIVHDESSVFSLVRKTKERSKKEDTTTKKNDCKTRWCILGKPYMILKNGEPFLDEVSLEPTLMHAPKQAFINITSRCMYNCSFCVTPELDKDRKACTVERWIELILAHEQNPDLEAVAITSGVAESPHKTVVDMVKIIKAVRDRLPKIPIGVEPYLTAKEDVDLLFEAGADEIKINLETPNREIFDKVCHGMVYDDIYQALKYSVTVFGRNKICSNLILGLGETDDDVLKAVEDLAKNGVTATLRALRLNEYNIPKLTKALGFTPRPVPPERLVYLGEKQKEILDKYELSTLEFKTMCHRCKSCDIVPQQDV